MEIEQSELFSLNITNKLKQDLSTAATWGRIAAIIGFISAAASMYTNISNGSLIAGIITAGINVYIYIYLFQFGRDVKKGLDSNDTFVLNDGLHSLKTYFKICGVMLIILLSIVLLAIIVAIGAAAFTS